MPENDAFWDFYWETRLQEMENLGKREAILAASRLIRRLNAETGRLVRVLELGCGEGQIVGALVDAHAQICATSPVIGVDYNPQSLARCRRDYPGLRFIEGDFTDPALLARLGSVDLLLLVNALHEVFSTAILAAQGEAGVPAAKEKAANALGMAASVLAPGGWLLLFDGLEPPGDPAEPLTIRFLSAQARRDFETFAREYQPFQVHYTPTADPLCVTLPRRLFTRYLTKSIFLGKQHLWQNERWESYQYFTEDEFRAAFVRHGLRIHTLRTLTVNSEKWRRWVELVPPDQDFPQEHILILAQRD